MRRTHVLLALWSLPLLTIPAVAWLVGNQDEEGGTDYMFHPPSVPDEVERVVGAGSLLAMVFVLVVSAVAKREGRIGRPEVSATAPLVAAGAVIGSGARVVFAAVGGANIGGGLVLMFGTPLVAGLVATGVARWWRLRSG